MLIEPALSDRQLAEFDAGPTDDSLGCRKPRCCKVGPTSSSLWSVLPCLVLPMEGNFFKLFEGSLPVVRSSDYYISPGLKELATKELLDPGYCSRIPDFTIGRHGHGYVKFLGETDVRWLDLERIVKFHRHEVVVYEDEGAKPAVGQGLNKTAEVTLVLQLGSSKFEGKKLLKIEDELRSISDRQGAHFISFDPSSGEWKFLVYHFSRFGLSEDDEDIIMDEAPANEHSVEMNVGGDDVANEEFCVDPTGPELSHSLPAHLGLDPVRMKEMKMLMFSQEDEKYENYEEILSREKRLFHRENMRSPFHHSNLSMSDRHSPPFVRKMPLALLEYHGSNFDLNAPGTVLMAQQNNGLPFMTAKEGFKLDSNHDTPVTRSHSRNIVDAALFMGRSFRVGWGPGGILVHTGTPVGCHDHQGILSSEINLEKVAIDKVARDESNKGNQCTVKDYRR
ncbi:hypothetical protein Nepgr_028813 [Nepenthes gracilis]|uniref:Peptidase S59 domain-containing protein n=1 Tax=Nepenthes gracilis TaxID=150966 RepID=A0AAD3Y4A1_NEPGR|nr:hypothetical protein Nepgr_028813 [Nepenthes gracilis]